MIAKPTARDEYLMRIMDALFRCGIEPPEGVEPPISVAIQGVVPPHDIMWCASRVVLADISGRLAETDPNEATLEELQDAIGAGLDHIYSGRCTSHELQMALFEFFGALQRVGAEYHREVAGL